MQIIGPQYGGADKLEPDVYISVILMHDID